MVRPPMPATSWSKGCSRLFQNLYSIEVEMMTSNLWTNPPPPLLHLYGSESIWKAPIPTCFWSGGTQFEILRRWKRCSTVGVTLRVLHPISRQDGADRFTARVARSYVIQPANGDHMKSDRNLHEQTLETERVSRVTTKRKRPRSMTIRERESNQPHQNKCHTKSTVILSSSVVSSTDTTIELPLQHTLPVLTQCATRQRARIATKRQPHSHCANLGIYT